MGVRLTNPIGFLPTGPRRLVSLPSWVEAVRSSLGNGEPAEASDLVHRGVSEPRAIQHSFGQEVLQVDPFNEAREGPLEPARPSPRWIRPESFEKLARTPPDPAISGRELNDCAAKRANPHHWAVRSGAIANENPDLTSRRAEVGRGPSVSEVSPHVDESKAREATRVVRPDHLDIWVDALAKGSAAGRSCG